MANTGYTRNLTFTVNDKQIKRATDRLFQSLDRIEKKLDLIAGRGNKSGFKRLELGADKSTKKVNLLSAAVNKTKQTFSTLETTLRTFAGTVNVLNNVRLGFKGAIVEALTFNNLLRDQAVLLNKMGRAAPGSPYMRNAMAGGDPLNPRGGTHPYRYFNEQGTLGGLHYFAGRKRGAWQEDLRNRMGIRRQALERSGTGFGSFSKDVSFHQAFRASRGMNYGGMTSGQTAVDKSIKRHEKHLAKINKATNKTASILGKQAAASLALPPGIGTQYGSPIGPMPATFGQRAGQLGNRLGLGKNANPQGVFANSKGLQGRLGGAASSGLIGGGFPLLFGQSGLASVLGGVGGAAGGLLGGGFGFGLSIAGTAAAQKIQEIIDFRKSIAELNKDMKSMGFNAGYSASEIVKLGKSLNITKQEAVQVAEQFKRFGKDGGGFAALFGGDVGSFNAVVQANDFASAMGAIKQLNKDLAPETELRYLQLLKTAGVEETINQVIKERTKNLKDEFNQKQLNDRVSLGKFGPTGVLLGQMFQGPKQAKDLVQFDASQDQTIISLKAYREEFRQIKLEVEEIGYSVATEVERIDTELRKLNNTQYQVVELSKSIGSSFSESFKGIIQGTMTVQDAFRNMFSRIADHFLDMAARMAAAQLQKGILSLFNFGANPLSALSNSTLPTNVGSLGNDVFRAAGGPVTGGSPYVVGEKGPELFVPGSSGNIVPNHAMGGANIVVNVDASGSSVEGDAGAAQELGSMLAAAIQAELVKEKRPGGLLA